MTDGRPQMVFLGFGKFVRSDRIYAVEPITDERRGSGRRTLVWVEGIPEPIVASRTERSILAAMGAETADGGALLEGAVALARRVADAADSAGPLLRRSIKAEAGVDLEDLGRRARRVLAATTGSDGDERLFDEE